MPKTKISEFSSTPANNTDIDGINIAEGCPPSAINNAIRELMAQLKDQQAGLAGDNFTVGGDLTVTGSTTLGSALPIAQGGTGQTTASGAINALMPSQTSNSGKYLTTNGVSVSWGSITPGTGTVSSVGLSTSLSGIVITNSPVTSAGTLGISGTLGVVSGGTGVASITAGAVLIGNGTSAVSSISPGTSGQVLTSNGTAWASSSLPSASSTVSGIVSTGSQTFAGSKTFSSAFSATATGNRIGPTANPSPNWPLFVASTTADPALNVYNGVSSGYAGNFMYVNGNSNPIIFQHGNPAGTLTVTGSISGTASAVSYNTTSDYRLKENVVPLSDAITKLKLLAPKRFTWKNSPEEGIIEGFIAHEVQEIVPNAVTGAKDSVDAKGNIIPQGMDASFLVPLLTAALQEAIARIEALEARNV